MNGLPWMDGTTEEIYSWVDRNPVDGDGNVADMKKYHHEEEPSLSSTDSEQSHSSYEEEDEESLACVIDYGVSCCSHDRRVSFQEHVEVREFAVTVGNHPCCTDGLPLTLDWAHSEESLFFSLDDYNTGRISCYRAPRRLSYDERRDRLCAVGTEDDQKSAQNEEVNMVMNFLLSCWAEHSILPPPMFEHLGEESEEKASTDEINEQQLDRYHRYLKRSNCFSEDGQSFE